MLHFHASSKNFPIPFYSHYFFIFLSPPQNINFLLSHSLRTNSLSLPFLVYCFLCLLIIKQIKMNVIKISSNHEILTVFKLMLLLNYIGVAIRYKVFTLFELFIQVFVILNSYNTNLEMFYKSHPIISVM